MSDITNLPSVEGLPPWQIVRGIRRRRGMNQRELARAVGLPVSTISRIEARKVQPKFETLALLLRACGFVFIVAEANRQYEPLVPDRLSDRLSDEADRRPPAHLPVWLIHDEYDPPWWGWGRVAWSMRDRTVPTHTYRQRPKYDRGARKRWNDAT